MTYIVNENCINCKYTDCVEVCPVDCFYEGENMLVIHPDECIDCGVCEPECPPEAILPDSEPEAEKWLDINREMSEIWPNIGQKIDEMPNAKAAETETGKFDKYFTKAPGKGNQLLIKAVDQYGQSTASSDSENNQISDQQTASMLLLASVHWLCIDAIVKMADFVYTNN